MERKQNAGLYRRPTDALSSSIDMAALEEAVLRHPVGGPAIMEAPLDLATARVHMATKGHAVRQVSLLIWWLFAAIGVFCVYLPSRSQSLPTPLWSLARAEVPSI